MRGIDERLTVRRRENAGTHECPYLIRECAEHVGRRLLCAVQLTAGGIEFRLKRVHLASVQLSGSAEARDGIAQVRELLSWRSDGVPEGSVNVPSGGAADAHDLTMVVDGKGVAEAQRAAQRPEVGHPRSALPQKRVVFIIAGVAPSDDLAPRVDGDGLTEIAAQRPQVYHPCFALP